MQLTTDQPQNWDVVTIRNKAKQCMHEVCRDGYPKSMETLVFMADELFNECEELDMGEENLNAMYAAALGMYLAVIHIRRGMIDDLNGCF